MRCDAVASTYGNLLFPSYWMFGLMLEHYSFCMFTGNLFFPCVSVAPSLWIICENIGSKIWDLWYTSSSLEDYDVTEELYVWYLLVIWVYVHFFMDVYLCWLKKRLCFISLLCLVCSQFVLAKNLWKEEIVGYLYVGFSFV